MTGETILVVEDEGLIAPRLTEMMEKAGYRIAGKERFFERGFGKNTGLGLFLVREILGLTGITIRETGTFGTGARFEMTVPAGAFRYPTEGQGRFGDRSEIPVPHPQS